ncbi:MAG: YggT family protein [Lachnospirales bacterium]
MNIGVLLIEAISIFERVLVFAIIIRALLSWVVPGNNSIATFIDGIISPIMTPIKKMVYKSPLGGPGMVVDISPIIAYFFIHIVAQIAIVVVDLIF